MGRGAWGRRKIFGTQLVEIFVNLFFTNVPRLYSEAYTFCSGSFHLEDTKFEGLWKNRRHGSPTTVLGVCHLLLPLFRHAQDDQADVARGTCFTA